jgi:hypothetical protein
MRHNYIFLLLLLVLSFASKSQDLTNPKKLIKGKGLDITGQIMANYRFYAPIDIPNRQTGFQYFYSGKIQADLFGKIKIPVTFSYTNQKAVFGTPSLRSSLPIAQPFNRLSLKPRYKEHTAYFGTNALTFSPFTLNGHRFNGVGYEYKSNKFPIYGGFQYGQLVKPIPIDTILTNSMNKPAYRRNGHSGKIGYHQNDDYIEITYLSSSDRLPSLPKRLDSKNIFAEQNFAGSVAFQKVIKKFLFFKADYGRTAIGRIVNLSSEIPVSVKTLGGKLENRTFKHAFKSDIAFKKDNLMIGAEYSWLDPNYRTFGGYYFNNDLETIALKSSIKLYENKIDLKGEIGKQRSNLDNSKPQSQERWVYNINSVIVPNKKMMFSANYSTFASFSNFQNQFLYLKAIDPFQEIDTLNYRQINTNFTTNASWVLPSKNEKFKNSLLAMLLVQKGDDKQGNAQQKTQIANGNIGISHLNTEKNYTITLSINAVKSQLPTLTEWMLGPSATFTYPIFQEKLQTQSNVSYTKINGGTVGNEHSSKQVVLGTFGLTSTLKKVHKLSLTAMFLKQSNPVEKQMVGENFSETTITLSYQYNFKLIDFKIK